MDKERFDKLLEKLNDQERITLTVLYNSVGKALKQVNANNTASAINDWKKSESAYDETFKKLWAKYYEPTLANILDVVGYLKAAGWKAAKSTCYNHKKAGLLRQEPDGTFKTSTVDQYAATHLTRLDGRMDNDTEKLAEETQRTRNRKEKAQAEHWELKTKIAKGLYVPRDAFERELAQRAMIFKADAEAFCRAQAGAIVGLVGGDKERIPDLIDYMLSAVAGWMSRYSADREFTVLDPALAAEAILQDADDDEGMEDLEE